VTSFAEIATQYAHDVVDGTVLACKWHRLACQRHLNDLARSATDWPYEFNPELTDRLGKAYFPAERVCAFAELMPHIKGDWAARGELIKLERWEIFILTSIFGWINKATKRRRFRVADLFVPRKNSKSTLAAIIGLFMLACDGEFGAEVYSGATSEDQAYEVFRPANLMARSAVTAEYRKRFGVTVNVSNIAVVENNSKFEPVIGKPGDGASPSCAIVDEYHEHKTPELYDTMQTGMGARSQPLMMVITTSGSDVSGPCYMHEDELKKVLEGTIENDQRFGIIFTIDEGDDWTSEEALRKANPNYDISVDGEFLRTQQRDAIGDPRKQNVFKTKHLNIWVAASSPWLNLFNLQRSGDTSLKLEDFKGETCTIGTDLASKIDIASAVKLFQRSISGKTHYYAFSRNYVPEAAARKPENVHYQGWIAAGHMIATPGNMISLKEIEEDIVIDSERHLVSEVAMDSWGAREMAPSLQEQGFTVVDVPMQVKHLSEPMKTIAALIDDERFHHDGNPAFVWMLSNVEVLEDRNGNIFPRKLRAVNKIDAAVALIVAMARGMVNEPQGSVNEWLTSPVIV
jgi:phage terminase large subunit-like protein